LRGSERGLIEMTWAKVQEFINKHSLPYKVERYNMSLRGTLIDRDTKDAVCYTVKDATDFLRRYARALESK